MWGWPQVSLMRWRFGHTIMDGALPTIGIFWDDSARRRSDCRGWRGPRITFCGCMTIVAARYSRYAAALHVDYPLMNEDCGVSRLRHRVARRKPAVVQYTAKDFQLEVLGKFAEVQNLAESLEEAWNRNSRRSGAATSEVRHSNSGRFGSDCALSERLCGARRAQHRKTRHGDRSNQGAGGASGADCGDEYGRPDTD